MRNLSDIILEASGQVVIELVNDQDRYNLPNTTPLHAITKTIGRRESGTITCNADNGTFIGFLDEGFEQAGKDFYIALSNNSYHSYYFVVNGIGTNSDSEQFWGELNVSFFPIAIPSGATASQVATAVASAIVSGGIATATSSGAIVSWSASGNDIYELAANSLQEFTYNTAVQGIISTTRQWQLVDQSKIAVAAGWSPVGATINTIETKLTTLDTAASNDYGTIVTTGKVFGGSPSQIFSSPQKIRSQVGGFVPATLYLDHRGIDGAGSAISSIPSNRDDKWHATIIGQNLAPYAPLGNQGYENGQSPRNYMQFEREWDSTQPRNSGQYPIYGLASCSTANATVTGDANTKFLTQFRVGDPIKVGTAAVRSIASIASNSSLTTTANASSNQSLQSISSGRLQLEGIISVSPSSRYVYGIGTKFTEQLVVNKYITLQDPAGNYASKKIASIVSNTLLTLTDFSPLTNITSRLFYSEGLRLNEWWVAVNDVRAIQINTLGSDQNYTTCHISASTYISVPVNSSNEHYIWYNAGFTSYNMQMFRTSLKADYVSGMYFWPYDSDSSSWIYNGINGDILFNSAKRVGNVTLQSNSGSTLGGKLVIGGGGTIISSISDNPTLDTKAILDLQSTTKGFKTPRMSDTQRVAITSPTEGLEVYDTSFKCKFIYRSSRWESVSQSRTLLDITNSAGSNDSGPYDLVNYTVEPHNLQTLGNKLVGTFVFNINNIPFTNYTLTLYFGGNNVFNTGITISAPCTFSIDIMLQVLSIGASGRVGIYYKFNGNITLQSIEPVNFMSMNSINLTVSKVLAITIGSTDNMNDVELLMGSLNWVAANY